MRYFISAHTHEIKDTHAHRTNVMLSINDIR